MATKTVTAALSKKIESEILHNLKEVASLKTDLKAVDYFTADELQEMKKEKNSLANKTSGMIEIYAMLLNERPCILKRDLLKKL